MAWAFLGAMRMQPDQTIPDVKPHCAIRAPISLSGSMPRRDIPARSGVIWGFSAQRRAQAKRAQVIAHDHLAEAQGRKVPCRSKRADIAA